MQGEAPSEEDKRPRRHPRHPLRRTRRIACRTRRPAARADLRLRCCAQHVADRRVGPGVGLAAREAMVVEGAARGGLLR